ncbi:O-methyltransferase [Streptomyces sp. NPDC001139]
MTTLHSPRFQAVLRTLTEAAQVQEPETGKIIGKRLEGLDRSRLTDNELADLVQDVYMAVSPDLADLLYLLVRGTGATTVVELGTSLGVSALTMGAALRDNGRGRLITSELSSAKCRAVRKSVAEAGLEDIIEIREGDARETLKDLPEPVDLVLLDGFAHAYVDVLKLLEPRMRPGSVVVADGLPGDKKETIGPFRSYIEQQPDRYHRVRAAVFGSAELIVRIG